MRHDALKRHAALLAEDVERLTAENRRLRRFIVSTLADSPEHDPPIPYLPTGRQ